MVSNSSHCSVYMDSQPYHCLVRRNGNIVSSFDELSCGKALRVALDNLLCKRLWRCRCWSRLVKEVWRCIGEL
jgi:hypothetical protein